MAISQLHTQSPRRTYIFILFFILQQNLLYYTKPRFTDIYGGRKYMEKLFHITDILEIIFMFRLKVFERCSPFSISFSFSHSFKKYTYICANTFFLF
jgi:hypothetical protein